MPEEGSFEKAASGIYGTILSTALIAAYTEDPGSDPLQVAVVVVVTAAVFWVAHAYADVLARGLVGSQGRGLTQARAELAREWPLLLGSLPPVLPLLLAPLEVLSDDSAETLAIASGVSLLAGWGMTIAWRKGSGLIGIAISTGASAFFGVVIVGLKALVH
jgi:hypothetical protein